MTDQDQPLPPDVRDELRRAGSARPDDSLRARTIDALRAEGLLDGDTAGDRRGRRRLAIAAAVAALAVFLAGYWAGSLGGGPALPGDPPATDGLYLLLLREPVGGLATDGRTEEELTAEYAAWARSEARAGRLVRGERLAPEALRIGGARVPDRPATTEISGFFLIRAPDLERAANIAQDCPHVRYGGAIELRPIMSG